MVGVVAASSRRLRAWVRDRHGNVSIIFAFSVLPMLLALGSGVDYGLAMKRQARMNAAADAAALDAVTPSMMAQPAAVAKTAATAFFNSQVTGMVGANYNPTNLTVTVTDSTSSGSLKRTATVSYRATSTNSFAALLQVPTLTIKGASTATATAAPNIDFYLMLDTSPSMAIAATASGIATMNAHTTKQGGGCAFACHETNPTADNLQNEDGPNQDNYALARKYNVTLRIDLVQQAVANLIAKAQQTSLVTGATYRMAGYTFDFTTKQFISIYDTLPVALLKTANIQLLTVYNNSGYLTSTVKNNDADTDFGTAFTQINHDMPTPGNGSGAPGDPPQGVLFIVTDGVSDYAVGPSYGSRSFKPFGPSTNAGVDWCTSIKSRGTRIAVLYTTYNPLPLNSFYNSNIKPLQPTIGTTAQNCASPGLYTQVDTGGDISGAITQLFSMAISTARLTN